MKSFKILIAGQWMEASDGAKCANRNPADLNQLNAEFPLATVEDANRAVEAARQAQKAWAELTAPARGEILDTASHMIEARSEELAVLITREEGKTLAESRGEVSRARDIFRYFAGEGWRHAGSVYPASVKDEMLYSKREPLGVVTIITPWNFPIAIPAWKIAPALIYGNTVVFKPAKYGSLVGLALAETLVDAGLPAGVLNCITGAGGQLSRALIENPSVNGISFTGSYPVGTQIYERAIKNLTRVQLEMGGKNPLVIMDDADLKLAVELVVRSGFGLTGQACTATSRVIVHEGIVQEFSRALQEAARLLKVGNGLEGGTQMGPAVTQDQLDTDLEYIQIGQDEGAKLLVGGKRAQEGGYFIQPTVFDQVDISMRIAREEIFGPVISMIHATDLEDAIVKANAITFGLSAGIVTRDMHNAFRFANQVEAGVVKVNEATTGLALQAPFGGFKHSSANTFKEQGPSAIEFYTRTKTVYIGHG
ncbi:MAG: aldehyde dehydrogenase family protein [Anaerolineales bacterium]|jgi:aldehyde dehydrogenase (NAD+)